jgi:hypothetical protein
MYMLVSLPIGKEIDHDFLATWAATDQLTSSFFAAATPETIFAAPKTAAFSFANSENT